MVQFDTISSLHQYRSDFKIQICVYRKWETRSNSRGKQLEFIFIDELGNKIEASVYNESLIPYINRVLEEGVWSVIDGFTMYGASSGIRNANHWYRIIIDQNTKLEIIDRPSPHRFLPFKDFKFVSNLKFNREFPIDLIGQIENVQEIETIIQVPGVKGQNFLKFCLRDHKGICLKCVSSGDFADDFNNEWLSLMSDSAICVLTDWRVEQNQGKAEIVNVPGISRYFFNTLCDEVEQFKIKMNGQ